MHSYRECLQRIRPYIDPFHCQGVYLGEDGPLPEAALVRLAKTLLTYQSQPPCERRRLEMLRRLPSEAGIRELNLATYQELLELRYWVEQAPAVAQPPAEIAQPRA